MTIDQQTGEVPLIRPFADVLRDLNRGEVADEAAAMLTELTQAVQAHGKKGIFTLKIEVAPMKGNSNALLVTAKADVKPPSGDPIAAAFFTDASGNLLRDDPSQLALPIRDVSRKPTTIKEATK